MRSRGAARAAPVLVGQGQSGGDDERSEDEEEAASQWETAPEDVDHLMSQADLGARH